MFPFFYSVPDDGCYLICFPMTYRDFSVKITVKITMKIRFLFSLFVKTKKNKKEKRTFYEFKAKSLAQRV